MNEITLICRNCQSVVSKTLTPVKTGESVKLAFTPNSQKHWSAVRQGFVLFVEGEVRRAMRHESGWPLDCSGVWIHPDDLADDIDLTDGYSTNCCGPDGMEGPNRICRCGSLVGTEESECFQCGIFIPDEATTYWQQSNTLEKMTRHDVNGTMK